MPIRTRLQPVWPRGKKLGEDLASAAARTIIRRLPTVAPVGAKAAPTGINGEDLTTTAT